MTTNVRITHRGGNHEVIIKTTNPAVPDSTREHAILTRFGAEVDVGIHSNQVLEIEEGLPLNI